jgi:hypothetical protein
MSAAPVAISRRDQQWVYFSVAGFCAAITLLSFVPTYWGPVAGGRLEGGGTVLHVHAVLFSAWPLLFLVQTWLTATSRLRLHRSLGVLGAALALAMLWSGLWVTAFSINVQSALGYPVEARAFAIVSFTKIIFFAACVALAVANVPRPNVHKRLMVLAMLPLVQTAIPRILYLLAPPGSPQRPGLGDRRRC